MKHTLWNNISPRVLSREIHIVDTRLTVFVDVSFFGSGGWATSFHNHPVYEVHMIQRGIHHFHIDQNTVELKAGDCVMMHPQTYHSIMNVSDEPTSRCSFRFEMHTQNGVFERILEAARQNAPYTVVPFTKEFTDTIDAIKKECEQRPVGFLAVVDSLLMRLVVLLFRQIDTRLQRKADHLNDYVQSDRYNEIDAFFLDNIAEDPAVESLAKTLNVSVRQTNRILKQAYGLSFKEKLLQMRIHHAKNLLVQEQWSVATIAEKVGFSSPGYFCQSFKKAMGMTPIQYRDIKCNGDHKRPSDKKINEGGPCHDD